MILKLQRIVDTGQSTIGMFYVDGKFECFTLEDTFHQKKIPGETRIPEGSFILKLNSSGAMNRKYFEMFGPEHKGMLEICDIPDFKFVYFHIGNTAKDTKGCILVGRDMGKNHISNSKDAYCELYPKISEAILQGNKVKLKIIDCDRRKEDVCISR